MRPPERFPPDDPQEWLNRARSNLALAKTRAADVYLEDLCFEAQQAAEKAIKSVMVRRAVEYPYVLTWLTCCRYLKKQARLFQPRFARPRN